MAKKTETTEKKERKVTAIADLPTLEGDAKKQFDALMKAKVAFDTALVKSGSVPLRHLRVLRRNWNREFITVLQARRGDIIQERKNRLAERIKKLEERLAALNE